ncbi:UNVERIFIED_ORG: hypothetical protein GGD59_003217 [Rhizobium esperanzae]
MGEIALSAEQQATDLVLKLLYGAAEGRLSNIAPFGCTRKIACFADGQEITYMMNIHRRPRDERDFYYAAILYSGGILIQCHGFINSIPDRHF